MPSADLGVNRDGLLHGWTRDVTTSSDAVAEPRESPFEHGVK